MECLLASFDALTPSVRPSNRRDDADIIAVGRLVRRTVVVRVEQGERDEQIAQQLLSDAGIELRAVPPAIAQARVVLQPDVETRGRPIIGEIRRLEEQESLQV